MGNAFVAGPKNKASRGRDMTNEERKSEVSHIGAQREAEGPEEKYGEELRRGRPTSPPVRRSLFGEESPEDAGKEASRGSPDLFSPTLVPTSPLDSAYETGRKTPSCCPVEPNTNTDDEAGVVYETARTSRTAKKRDKDAEASSLRTSPQQRRKDRRQLTFDTSEESNSEEENQTPTKTQMKRIESSQRRRSRSRSSPTKVRPKNEARASSKKRTPQKKRSTNEAETKEDSSFESSSSEEDGQVTKTKHILKPPMFDGLKPFETFWAQFKNCARYNQWNRSQKLVYLQSSLDGDVANILWDYGKEVTESFSGLTKTLKRRF